MNYRVISKVNELFIRLVATMMILSTILLVSCLRHIEPFTVIPEPDYAGPILEEMLIFENKNDYESYIKYYYKPLETQQQFEDVVSFTKDAFGDYTPYSKYFSDASFQYDSIHKMGYTVVYYYARFTKYPEDVLVEIVFRKIGGTNYVHTINLNGRGTYYK